MPKDKLGEQISFKEYFSRWKLGIEGITPIQKLTNEARGTLISLIGFITCFVALIIFREKLIVSWFAYGLILVFLGSTITTGLKYISLRQQLKIFKNIEKQINMSEEEIDSIKLKEDKK